MTCMVGDHLTRCDLDPWSSPLIESFAARSRIEPRSAFLVFPTARPELIFHFGDPFRVRDDDRDPWRDLPRSALLGPRRHRYWQSAGPRIDWFLVQLSALGCRRLLGQPLAGLWETDLALTDVWGHRADELHARLAAEPDFERRRQIAGEMLGQCALDSGGDAEVSRIGHFARTGELHSLDDLARALGVGQRRLRQRFAAEYGCGPKAFLNLMRFNRQMLEMHPLHRARREELVEHFDQSHAIHEFRRFTGMTPGTYARIKAGGDTLVVTGPRQPL